MSAELPARRRLKEQQRQAFEGGETESDPDAWRAFGTDTEAGRLLRRLYGSSEKPAVRYPKPRVDPALTTERPAFVPGGGAPDVDPRKATRRNVEVEVPVEEPKYEPVHLVDLVPRRKHRDTIEAELRAAQVDVEQYRPPLRKAVSTDKHKLLLQNQFTYKGGKALPEELTMPPIVGHIPLALQMNRDDDVGRARRRAGTLPGAQAASHNPESILLAEYERTFDEMARTVEERKEFLARMRELGQGAQHEAVVLAEIREQVREMERLDKLIAEKKGKR